MTKTQEITEKLQSGSTAVDLIKQGYKHGLVYKLNKQYKHNIPMKPEAVITKLSNDETSNSDSIDNDPEILQLRKDILKAELRKKLAEVVAPIEIEPRIATLEEKIAELEQNIEFQLDSLIDLQTVINNPPLSELYTKHQCSCGAKDYLDIKVQCTVCGKEMLVGIWPR